MAIESVAKIVQQRDHAALGQPECRSQPVRTIHQGQTIEVSVQAFGEARRRGAVRQAAVGLLGEAVEQSELAGWSNPEHGALRIEPYSSRYSDAVEIAVGALEKPLRETSVRALRQCGVAGEAEQLFDRGSSRSLGHNRDGQRRKAKNPQDLHEYNLCLKPWAPKMYPK